jgi:hypothetical protein
MKLAIELPPAQAEKLRAEAARLGLSPEDLARAALTDLLAFPDSKFEAAAARVLARNRGAEETERALKVASRLAKKYRKPLRELAR